MDRTLGRGSVDRSARVRRIKRVIIGLVAVIFFLPSILSVTLFIRVNKLEKQLTELSYERERVNVITESTTVNAPNKAEKEEATISTEVLEIEKIENAESSEVTELNDMSENEGQADDIAIEVADGVAGDEIKDVTGADDQGEQMLLKRVYLTFDDGPSSNTSKILDILRDHNVKGTFFVVGRLSDTTTPMYKKIVDEGHAIGMHSYTHKYGEIYKDVDSFIYDIDRIQSLIYEQTGVLSKLYRFPGGSSNHVSRTDINVLASELAKRDIKYFDWNVVSGDADSHHRASKEEIVRNCTVKAMSQEEAVILMHDLPEKAATVEALPDIIEYFQSIGVEILPLDENVYVHHTIEMTE